MPPANSPVNDPSRLAPTQPSRPSTRTPSPSTFLPVLRSLGSPVPDLASTLTIQAEDDVDDENINFLRAPSASTDDPLAMHGVQRDHRIERRRNNGHSRDQTPAEITREQRRLRDVHLRQRYNTHESWVESMRQTASRAPYGERAPNQQSLYDWAPAREEGNEEDLEEVLADLREQQPNTHIDVLRALARAQLDAQSEQRRLASARTSASNSSSLPHEHSLRSAAILQSVRRNRQLSARSRDLMQRYVMDRERAGHEPEDRDRSNSSMWFRLAATANEHTNNVLREERRMNNRGTPRDGQENASNASSGPAAATESNVAETTDSLRRRYLEDPGGWPVKFESSIKLLDWLTHPDCNLDSMLNFLNKEVTERGISLGIPDLAKLSAGVPPAPTSWLAPGMSFSGFQHAAPSGMPSTTLYRLANNQTISSTTLDPSAASNSAAAPTSGNATTAAVPRDRWAVRVSIHSVDYDNMTLQGTMEAFDVPNPPTSSSNTVPYRSSTSSLRSTIPAAESPAPSAGSHEPSTPERSPSAQAPPSTFSTYLEGELVDLSAHTLATHSFPATTADDAKYWRRLEPFSRLPDLGLARASLDHAWVERELRAKYVLMRWKEKCFVKECMLGREGARGAAARAPAPGAPSGGFGLLSISGFYYVSLRREDGRVEGLYFDPASSPYQHLELAPDGARGRGAWEFA